MCYKKPTSHPPGKLAVILYQNTHSWLQEHSAADLTTFQLHDCSIFPVEPLSPLIGLCDLWQLLECLLGNEVAFPQDAKITFCSQFWDSGASVGIQVALSLFLGHLMQLA